MIETTSKCFDQPLIQLFFKNVTEIKPIENCDEYK